MNDSTLDAADQPIGDAWVVTSISTRNLLGKWSHAIDFPAPWKTLCVFGQNGVGKTRLLSLVHDALTVNVPRLLATPFEWMTIELSHVEDPARIIDLELSFLTRSDGIYDAFDHLILEDHPDFWDANRSASEIALALDSWLTRAARRKLVDSQGHPVTDRGFTDSVRFSWGARGDNSEETEIFWGDKTTSLVARAADQIGYRAARGYNSQTFVDESTGQELEHEELWARHGLELAAIAMQVDEGLLDLLRGVPSIFIDVHRLKTIKRYDFSNPYLPLSRRSSGALAATEQYAADLVRRIREGRAEYALHAQRIDATYPGRLLESYAEASVALEEDGDVLRERLAARQDELVSRGLLDDLGHLVEPVGDPESWQAFAIRLHLKDSLRKLETLSDLDKRIAGFLQIVNSKLVGKRMIVDARAGFSFRDDDSAEIALGDLSSGEQHEVVLAYRLLFDGPDRALVLIDEPEISLHIDWQRMFLPDLEQVSEIRGTRFIVATHSPQIIDAYWSQTVSLDPSVQ